MPSQTQGSSTQPFQYTGQQRDGNGLIYLRARYYDPTTGRFLSRDLFAGKVSLPQSLNRYSYATNNPILWPDPTGMCDEPDPRNCKEYAGSSAGAGGVPGPIAVPKVSDDAYPKKTKAYDVGTYKDLVDRSEPGDKLQIHHLPQKALAKDLIEGYDKDNAPAIALPDAEHQVITALQNALQKIRSAYDLKQLVTQDIQMLEQYTQAPRSAIDKLTKLINDMYPGAGA